MCRVWSCMNGRWNWISKTTTRWVTSTSDNLYQCPSPAVPRHPPHHQAAPHHQASNKKSNNTRTRWKRDLPKSKTPKRPHPSDPDHTAGAVTRIRGLCIHIRRRRGLWGMGRIEGNEEGKDRKALKQRNEWCRYEKREWNEWWFDEWMSMNNSLNGYLTNEYYNKT